MLNSLIIKDFVIVDHLELDFAAGLTVLSGETGAGKSILIDALSLCLGNRADSTMVRQGATKADITAVFDSPGPLVLQWLTEHELAAEDTLIVRRVVDSAGKSKAYINQTPVTLNHLKTLGEWLVDIHGQHAFQSLVRPEEQMRILDSQGGHLPLHQEVRQAWKGWKEAKTSLEKALGDQADLNEQKERLAWQLEEIERIRPGKGEWEQLSEEHHRLSHAADLLSGAQQTLGALSEQEGALIEQLGTCLHRLTQLLDKDPRLTPAVEALQNADIQIQEAVDALSHYLRVSDLDPERLAELDERISAWHACARKLRVPPADLAERYEHIQAELSGLDAQSDVPALEKRCAALERTYRECASALSRARAESSRALSAQITEAMQGLSLKGGQFECALLDQTPGPDGVESIEFRVAGHAGSTPKPLSKVASGGELARISLAITVTASRSSSIPTLIFDEVDSGIGGAVAEVVGQYLRMLAQGRQVLCVTHLPQVAAQGHHHFVVAKRFNGQETLSEIRALEKPERIGELARMLGGQTVSDTTRAAALELLEQASSAG